MSQPVLTQLEGAVGRITLNRPKALHALNGEMCELMTEALMAWRDDPAVELILVDHAAETRGFCAGGDVIMLADSGKSDGKAGAAFFATEYRLNTLIHEYSKPYVAIIDGITMGGGVGISVHGSHRIATERTVFAMPETGIGLLPDVGGGYFLPRLKGQLGMWLALTGARLKGEDVLAAGVATHFVNSEQVAGLTERLCADGLDALSDLQTENAGGFDPHRVELDEVFERESVEHIIASLSAGSDWAKAQADILATKSPLTMKVAFRQLRESAGMNFRDVMAMEYRIASRMIKTENFQEGIRAVLIDRDNDPQWNPSSLDGVSEELVDSFFASLGDDELQFLKGA